MIVNNMISDNLYFILIKLLFPDVVVCIVCYQKRVDSKSILFGKLHLTIILRTMMQMIPLMYVRRRDHTIFIID